MARTVALISSRGIRLMPLHADVPKVEVTDSQPLVQDNPPRLTVATLPLRRRTFHRVDWYSFVEREG